jgi:hypothetical protein
MQQAFRQSALLSAPVVGHAHSDAAAIVDPDFHAPLQRTATRHFEPDYRSEVCRRIFHLLDFSARCIISQLCCTRSSNSSSLRSE